MQHFRPNLLKLNLTKLSEGESLLSNRLINPLHSTTNKSKTFRSPF
jgi:hypothetical protein